MDNVMEKKIDAIFSKWNQGLSPGGQVLVRQKGEIIYKKNFGYSNIEHNVPMEDDTVLHVASVSKQFTVMSVLLLHDEGKLSIDDDIRKYIPDLVKFTEPITIKNMMNNISGIRDQWELLMMRGVRIVDTITQRDALSIISKQKSLNFEPMSQYLYSNSNFTLLVEIVERLTGMTLNEFAKERIFKPLGMNRTCFKDSYWKVIQNRADSYFDNGEGEFFNSVLNYGTYGATALNTTATDFMKWLDNYKNPTICSKEVLDLMFEAPTLKDGTTSSYAGGLFVGEHKGHKYIEHGGADASFRSQIIRFTEDDLDIIVFSNTQNINTKDAAYGIADIIFGYENNCNTVTSEFYVEDFNITDAEGYYFTNIPNVAILSLDVSIKDGRAHVDTSYGPAPITNISGNHFKINHSNMEVYLGENGGVKLKDLFIPFKKLTPYGSNPQVGSTYGGRYESHELDTWYSIVEEEGKLYMEHLRNGRFELYNIEEDKFVANKSLTYQLEFLRESGKVVGLSLTGGRIKSIVFVRDSALSC